MFLYLLFSLNLWHSSLEETSYITFRSQHDHQIIQIFARYSNTLKLVMNTQHEIIKLEITLNTEIITSWLGYIVA
jgi:hypothetical protein